MKKLKAVLMLIAFMFLLAMPFNCILVTAETEQPSALEDTIEDCLEKLDLSELEEYLKRLEGENSESIRDRLIRYVKGDSLEFTSIFTQTAEVFFQETIALIPDFACITAIALLCGILSSLQIGIMENTVTKTVYVIAFVSALIPVVGIISECYTSAIDGLNNMQRQMEIVFPILLTLLATSGGVTTVAVCRPSLAFLSTSMIRIISDFVFPITIIMLAFSMLTKISDDFKFGKFTALLKSINKWLIGIGLSVFGLFFTIQGITTTTYDGIVKRVAKYAIGNGIPIVGGFLSGGFDLAVAGSVLIKNSLGYFGIALMISSIFKPIILLLSTTILLRLSSAMTSPFGESKISDFLSETADCLNYLSAGVLFSAFLYFLAIIVLISVTGAFL